MTNKTQPAVRKRPSKRSDQRVERTKHALGTAIIELMLERHFDAITVQDVLNRAGVGRATFYTHYRSKRDLFLSANERFLERVEQWLDRPSAATRIVPVTEFFEHVHEARPLLQALRDAGHFDVVFQDMAEHFARMIAKRLYLLEPELNAANPSTIPVAKFCAGAALEMLKWWLDQVVAPEPAEMDELYHELVRRALVRSPAPASLERARFARPRPPDRPKP
ncbi:MAG TPA: TetR/AcrR family transcriptional regulator [Gemmatimonadaceae bacterium]|nr:TetR/AcrR family transcriptional regulator [Gemmatimonadaceae bacterium]